MAFDEHSQVWKIGSADASVISTGAAVADGNYSLSGHATTWTNDEEAEYATFTFDGTLAAQADADSVMELFARLLDVSDSTEDANEPSDDFPHIRLGSFPLDSGTSGTHTTIVSRTFRLPAGIKASQTMDFYIKNGSGQSLNSGATVDIQTVAKGRQGT